MKLQAHLGIHIQQKRNEDDVIRLSRWSGYAEIAAVLSLTCNGNGIIPETIPYVPEVTFSGYFNNDYDSLAGNMYWPNTCRLVGDTVRIYCYSSFFGEENRIRHGDLLRIDLFPDSGEGFEKRNSLFHLARYYEYNESYTINRGDTVDRTIRFESQIRSFAREAGGSIDLDMIYVATPPVAKGRLLEIKNGRLSGRIHQ